MKVLFKDTDNLAGELKRMNSIKFDAIEKKQLTEMLNRARAGGTPVGKRKPNGQLRASAGVDFGARIMGYTKEYAPHVEYGHRVVVRLRDGTKAQRGYVRGQRFLYKNLQTQLGIFKSDLEKAIGGK